MRRRLDVAVYAPRAWPLYVDPPAPSLGGAEVQSRYLASALSGLGLRVGHIVSSHDGLPREWGGVELIHCEPPDLAAGRSHRARRLFEALDTADAAVYIHRSAGPDAGLIAAYSKVMRRRFVLSTSWDGDLVAPPIERTAARALYRAGVWLADAIVVQTRGQLHTAGRRLRRKVHVIPSFAEPAAASRRERSAFLWIGRVVDYKDPLAYAELAARVPEARFWMVADMSTDHDVGLNRRLRDAATAISNLEVLPPRPREELFELYERAVAVVNTSRVEGFPNTFIEGWARGAPAISFRVDPDGVIAREALGSCASGSFDDLVAAVRAAWQSRADPSLAEGVRGYLAREHSFERVGTRWVELLDVAKAADRDSRLPGALAPTEGTPDGP
jgi:glycosyltransferase involved in cell wall biosynthesis